jgi:hypothetical protein
MKTSFGIGDWNKRLARRRSNVTHLWHFTAAALYRQFDFEFDRKQRAPLLAAAARSMGSAKPRSREFIQGPKKSGAQDRKRETHVASSKVNGPGSHPLGNGRVDSTEADYSSFDPKYQWQSMRSMAASIPFASR